MNYLVNLDVSEEITDPLTGNIIGAAIDVHRALGPGLLESAYEVCLLCGLCVSFYYCYTQERLYIKKILNRF